MNPVAKQLEAFSIGN